jgi:predicted DsbA family dithiol-disulfide isomerase
VAPGLEVVEYTDPACPWAWGSEPKFRWLRGKLTGVRWRRVFGILFDDDEDPAPDPAAEAAWYEKFIDGVTEHTDAPKAFHLAWVARTSWPASLAAKAAEAQGSRTADRVLRRLRETTFVLGTPADDAPGVLTAVGDLPGLDINALRVAMTSDATRQAVHDDWRETRRPCPEVLDISTPGPHSGRAKHLEHHVRYALPTLVFTGPGGRFVVPGWRPLREYADAARAATGVVLDDTPPYTTKEAFVRFGSLTEPELTLLTGRSEPPSGAVAVPTANGPLWTCPGP